MIDLLIKAVALGMVVIAVTKVNTNLEVSAIMFVGGNILMTLSLILDELKSRKRNV